MALSKVIATETKYKKNKDGNFNVYKTGEKKGQITTETKEWSFKALARSAKHFIKAEWGNYVFIDSLKFIDQSLAKMIIDISKENNNAFVVKNNYSKNYIVGLLKKNYKPT